MIQSWLWACPKTKLLHNALSLFLVKLQSFTSLEIQKCCHLTFLSSFLGFGQLCLVRFTGVSSAALNWVDVQSCMVSFVRLSQHVSFAFDLSLCIFQVKTLSWSELKITIFSIRYANKQQLAQLWQISHRNNLIFFVGRWLILFIYVLVCFNFAFI